MVKKVLVLLALCVVVFLGVRYAWQKRLVVNENGKLLVTTSFYPIYYFTSEIGGNRIEVVNITPQGIEPHDYELTAQDMILASRSRLMVINGGLEPWGDRLKRQLEDVGIPVVVAGEGLYIDDPHVWLSPIKAMKMVEVITEGLVTIDGRHGQEYRSRAEVLKDRLRQLDDEYREGLSECRLRTIFTAHKAFGHLVEEYGLEQVAVAGISPEQEPSLKESARIADLATMKGVRYIFFEELVSPKLAEVIAKEIGAETLVLNPLEGLAGNGEGESRDYFTEMRKNLTNLETALGCQ